MRIAITTWHSGPNPGTFFQLFGLYKYLEARGHHVEVVDYVHQGKDFLPRGLKYFLTQSFGLIRRKLKKSAYKRKYGMAEEAFKDEVVIRNQTFDRAYSSLKYTKKVVTDEDFESLNKSFDAFIVGSDQLWNSTMLNRRYLLDYVHSDKIKASYCPSVGTTLIMKRQRQQFKHYLSSFDYISTRECFLQKILQEELGKDVKHLLDPSMLFPKESYLNMAEIPEDLKAEDYLLCYFMPRGDEQRYFVKEYAKKHGLKLIIMPALLEDYTLTGARIICPTPYNFLGLIKNARTIFTSSFHCTIFSILFNKDLYVFEQPHSSKSEDISLRYTEQLTTYKMMHRFIRCGKVIEEENSRPIDYEQVNEIFQKRLEESQKFLNQFT